MWRFVLLVLATQLISLCSSVSKHMSCHSCVCSATVGLSSIPSLWDNLRWVRNRSSVFPFLCREGWLPHLLGGGLNPLPYYLDESDTEYEQRHMMVNCWFSSSLLQVISSLLFILYTWTICEVDVFELMNFNIFIVVKFNPIFLPIEKKSPPQIFGL